MFQDHEVVAAGAAIRRAEQRAGRKLGLYEKNAVLMHAFPWLLDPIDGFVLLSQTLKNRGGECDA